MLTKNEKLNKVLKIYFNIYDVIRWFAIQIVIIYVLNYFNLPTIIIAIVSIMCWITELGSHITAEERNKENIQ